MAKGGMFSELMSLSDKQKLDPLSQGFPDEEKPAFFLPKEKTQDKSRKTDQDADTELGPLSERAYQNRTYRFTQEETYWLEFFALQLGAKLGHKVPQNTLIRAFFRLAKEEWSTQPDANRLLTLLQSLKD
jgi:hypothetical protein